MQSRHEEPQALTQRFQTHTQSIELVRETKPDWRKLRLSDADIKINTMGKDGFAPMDIESDGMAKAARILTPHRTRMGFIVIGLMLSVVFIVITVSFVQNNGIQIDPSLPDSVTSLLDTNARPCSDFYQYACGNWLRNTSLSPDRASYARSFSGIKDANDILFRSILSEKLPLLSDLYVSCSDIAALNALDAAPLQSDLAAIRATNSKDELLTLAGNFSTRSSMSFLYPASVDTDDRDGTIQVLQVSQGGLSLPDRDYYVNKTRFEAIRVPFSTMISSLLNLAGWSTGSAEDIIEFENQVAAMSVPRTDLRDPISTYNPVTNLASKYPYMTMMFLGAKVPINSTTRVILIAPSFSTKAEELLKNTSLSVLQTIVAYQYIRSTASFLGNSFQSVIFNFFGKELFGMESPRPRDQQCTDRVNQYLGELMARYYIQRAFDLTSMDAIQSLVDDIRSTFQSRLERNSWMDTATRQTALAKLEKMTQLLGYPSQKREYPVTLHPKEYFKNIQALSSLEHFRAVGKIGTNVDKTEWSMNAHEVNAYYNPAFNQIVFPAGILQSPFFDAAQDTSMNYGAIGLVIGHEITHGFDDQGRNYDENGRLRPWWSNATANAFQVKTACMVEQYSAMGVYGEHMKLLGHVNGALTLGETIADIGGLAVAFQAYATRMKKQAVNGKTYTSSDTLDQLFFLSYAQAWCQKSTDQALQMSLNDVHPPARQRVNGAVMNNDDFARVFGCPANSPLNPIKKCRICPATLILSITYQLILNQSHNIFMGSEVLSSKRLRWGILGCGKISNDFVMGLQIVPDAEIVACASRSLDSAQAFAKLHNIATCYDSYADLCADPSIDVIYVGTVHTYHHPHAMLALSQGKHVLVEKPMAMNRRDAAEMVELAKSKNLFLMEGMWTRFFPAVRHARQLIASGAIGDVHAVHADMGFAFPANADRIWKRELGGGGLLDIGIYPLAFVSMAFQDETPQHVHTVGSLSEEGVDLYAVVTLQYSKHRYGTIQYSCLADFKEEVTILGTKGSIRIHAPAHVATSLTIQINGKEEETLSFPPPSPAPSQSSFNFGGSVGLSYEAQVTHDCIERGDLECSEYSLSESLFLAGLMDNIRQNLGVVYEADVKLSATSCL